MFIGRGLTTMREQRWERGERERDERGKEIQVDGHKMKRRCLPTVDLG